ncbi:hypothetical protein LOZ65_006147 [Ophidiomyces ophidiicola]|nr:hypothetical protein LOZ65_006147 [Ophidiomyces ophidiicola]
MPPYTQLPAIRLPEPYNTVYELFELPGDGPLVKVYQLRLPAAVNQERLPQVLHHPTLQFSELACEDTTSIPKGNNSPWARAQRSPLSVIQWHGPEEPTVAQIWILVYATFSIHPNVEAFRIKLSGTNELKIAHRLQAVGLAVRHPDPSAPPGQPIPVSHGHEGVLVVPRSSFWQGAGSPFGPRPVWAAGSGAHGSPDSAFPPRPLEYTVTTKFPAARVHTRHPIRPPKPARGRTIYSRYIPHLRETFSMVALDWQNEEHVNYFHTWQNEPRVAQSWNETGTLEEHREYLRKMHEDDHQFPVLGKFNDNFFAYFEIYWAKEDHVGTYYDADDYDRGRHFLVGDERFRGPHRVKAWHASLTHYMFLDEPRTTLVVGEPRASGTKVLGYDKANGYSIDKWIDLPHKRAALVKCSRERFFQLCPFEYERSAM